MKNWDNYRFVLAMDRYGTVALAAEMLGVSTITVTRHIENLTQEVGRPLFDFRNGRWVATDLGTALSKVAQAIESEDIQGTNIIGRYDEVLRGNVRVNSIAYIVDFFLAENLNLLVDKHPEIVPILEASKKIRSLAKGETEISVRLSEPKEARLIRSPLCKFPIGLFGVENCDRNEWVGFPSSMDLLPEMKLAHEHFGKPPRLRVDSYPGIARAAQQAGLACLMPTCIASKYPEFQPLNGDEYVAIREAWCVFHEMNKGNRNCAAVVEWIKEILKNPRVCACGGCALPVN